MTVEEQLAKAQEDLKALQSAIDLEKSSRELAEKKAKDNEGRAKAAEAKMRDKNSAEENALADLHAQLEASKTEIETYKSKTSLYEQARKKSEVISAVGSVSEQLAKGAGRYLAEWVAAKVATNEKGDIIVLGDDGKPRMLKDGRLMLPTDLVTEIISDENNKFLLKPAIAGGSGAKGNTNAGDTTFDMEKIESMPMNDRAKYIAGLTPEQRATLITRLSAS